MTNKVEDGDACLFREEGCAGNFRYPEAENCSCHLNVPCSSCLSVVLTCDDCGWELEEGKDLDG